MDSFEPLITTRTATPDEYMRVVELSQNMIHPEIVGIDNELWVKNPVEWMGEESKKGFAQVAVAYDAATESIVASGIGILLEGNTGYIRWMSTAEDFRGYGVGEQILNHLMGWFEEKNAGMVQLHATDKATEFYSQHGFQKDPDADTWWRKL